MEEVINAYSYTFGKEKDLRGKANVEDINAAGSVISNIS
jgi:hypothetical protein